MAFRTPTETLIAAMEDVEKADHVIIVMTDSEGDLIWSCSSDRFSVKLGLLEACKMMIQAQIKKED